MAVKQRCVLVGTLLLWTAVGVLLFFALREAPLAQIWAVLRKLQPGQLAALVAVNGLILVLMNLRWWVLLLFSGYTCPLPALLAYRLAAFGVSYFTPGPQFGGEPLQVHLLHRRQSVPMPAAISTVFLDRLVDLLSNFTFLVAGALLIAVGNLPAGPAGEFLWALAVLLLLFPALHLAALWRGKKPVTRLLGSLARRFRHPWLARANEVAGQSEHHIVLVVREKPGVLLLAVSLSGVVWAAFVFEFWLTLRFIGVSAGLKETISALTAARLAYLLPFPGGLGALEASQAIAARMLGWSPAAALALTLVIRARDIFLGLLGLWLGGAAYQQSLARRPRVRERRLS